jgi:DNA-binding transcriptional MocR family regulator
MTNDWKPDISGTDKPLYLAIVEALARDIKSGRLAPGSRVPTHRRLADRLRLALGTVTRAYAEAIKRGLLVSGGRRGTYIAELRDSSLSFSRFLESPRDTVRLSVNSPCHSDDPDLPAALRELARKPQTQELMTYTPPAGLFHHRWAAIRWLAANGAKAAPDEIILANGAQHALLITLMAIAKPGDIIAVDMYTYPGVKVLADNMNLNLMALPGDRHGPLPDAFESLCRRQNVRAFYCVPTLHNPTSVITSKSRRQAMALVAEKHGVLIVEDEINRRLVADPPPLISALLPEQTITISSVSKVLASGLRVGFIIAPSRLRQSLMNTLSASTLMVSPLSFEIFSLWVSDGTSEKILKKRIASAKRRQKIAAQILGGYKIDAAPTSYFIWLRLPDHWTSSRFTMEASQRGVSVAPAELFAVGRDTPLNAVRICLCGDTDLESLKKALETLAAILQGMPRTDTVTV